MIRGMRFIKNSKPHVWTSRCCIYTVQGQMFPRGFGTDLSWIDTIILPCNNKPHPCERGSATAAQATSHIPRKSLLLAAGRASGKKQTRLTPTGPFSWITQAGILITDKAIKRLQIQQSPGQKTTAAGEPPSTSANVFAACTGRHPTAPLSAQGKYALTPCQPPRTGLPKQALASHRLHGSPRRSLPTTLQNSLG